MPDNRAALAGCGCQRRSLTQNWSASARSAIIRQPIAIILESPMGVQHYVATLKLTPVTDGARCFAELSAEFECDAGRERELGELIGQGVFQAGFDASRRRFMR